VARREFWDLIGRLSEEGTTVFVSTHYMEEAEYCHRLALMHGGRIIAMDSPGALKASMEEPLFEIATDDAARAVEALRVSQGILEASMYGREVHAVVADEKWGREHLPVLLTRAGLECRSLRPIAPSLEDVFVSRVRRAGAQE
jgi:ABC-2 type transport system ATP-binding protein